MLFLIKDGAIFATRDNSMIFRNAVMLLSEEEIKNYHIVDDEGNEMPDDLRGYLKCDIYSPYPASEDDK